MLTEPNTSPTITLDGNEVDTVVAGTIYSEAGATAFDAEDGDITSSILVNYGTFSAENPVAGTYHARYYVTDNGGLNVSAIRTIVVVAATASNHAPVITLNGKSSDSIPAGETYNDPGASATDAEQGDLTGSIVINSGLFNAATPVTGTYTIWYTVKDSGGLSDTAYRTIIVVPLSQIAVDTTLIVAATLTGTAMVFADSTTIYKIPQSLTIPANYSVTFGKKVLVIAKGRVVVNGHLIIDEGTAFLMDENTSITCEQGTFTVTGSDEYPVIFKNLAPGKYWGYDYSNTSRSSYGIYLSSYSNANSSLNYLIVDSATTGILVSKDGVAINNSAVVSSKYAGMYFENCGPKDSASFVGNYFLDNGVSPNFYPLEIGAPYLTRLSGKGVFISNQAQAIRVISGTVVNTGTWRNHHTDSTDTLAIPYAFDGGTTTINNTNGVVITIEKGAVLKFKETGYLTIDNATLIAAGTAAEPIRFSNYEAGKYWGYDYTNTARSSCGILITTYANANTIFSHCVVDSSTTGITVKKDGLSISNTSVTHSKYAGIYFESCGPKDSLSFTNNLFVNNGTAVSFYPLTISSPFLSRLSGSLTFTSNFNDAILVLNGTIEETGTWKKQTVPYAFDVGVNTINNTNGVVITISPGAVLKFKADAYITISNGTLKADGSASDSIIFTNLVAGEYWGYNYGAGNVSVNYGIYMTSITNPNSSITYCSFSNATQAISSNDGQVTVKNCSISGCKFYGLYASKNGHAGIDEGTMSFNGNLLGDYFFVE